MNQQYEIKINGVLLPIASSVNIGLEDIDRDAGRGINDGKLIRQRVRTNVVKLSCQWLSLTDEQVRQLINTSTPTTFSLEYYDSTQGKRVVKTMYAGPKNYSLQRVANGIRYSDISINFIEV